MFSYITFLTEVIGERAAGLGGCDLDRGYHRRTGDRIDRHGICTRADVLRVSMAFTLNFQTSSEGITWAIFSRTSRSRFTNVVL